MNPQEFLAKWKQSTLKERSSYQSHFIDLCQLINHPAPTDLDPNGTFFTFEAFATKDTGGNGFADVWYKGHFAWEYKGKHANLDDAYRQLLQYREALQNPPLLVVCDIDSIQIHTNFTNTINRIISLTLDDLLTTSGLETLRSVFTSPDSLRSPQTPDQVTQEAARHFARLSDLLRKSGSDPSQAAHFLIQLLFCLFAEDAGLLPARLLSSMIEQTRTRPAAFTAQLSQLFQVMSTGGWFGPVEIPHFNGHLYDRAFVLDLDSDGLDILAQVCSLDWSQIQPSIFGTLFERSLDPSKRTQLGAHYTSQEDILLIVEPVLVAPLRRKWQEIQAQARELASQRDQAKGQKRLRLQEKLESLLLSFASEIASTQVLDPACGSGNFLYVALRQLLNLEKEVMTTLAELGGTRSFPSVNPSQLHGIEINEYAHQLAQATIWIGYIQWMRENGFGYPAQPVLKPLDNILHMDAILAYDDAGHPVEPAWPKVDVIIGNPPFLGDKKMRSELGDSYVQVLRTLYMGRIPGGADLVTYWFERARQQISTQLSKRVGLLSTNSIRTGSNRQILDRIKETGDIFMAWDDRAWVIDGASVRVSMVGFDDGLEKEHTLNGESVSYINSDLTSHVDVTQTASLPENANICFLGMLKNGPFDIDNELALNILNAPNPNKRPNSDVVRRRINGQDVAGRDKKGWVIDFGVDRSYEDASQYELPFEYVKRYVKPIRDESREKSLRTRWWLHARPSPALRAAIDGLQRCIVTPEVSKYRIFVWMETSVYPDHKLHVIARDDDYFMGCLQSRIHEVWTLAQCSWMGAGNDPSYSSSRTFETFPFPWPPGQETWDDPRLQAISSASKELVQLRDNWLNPPGLSPAELKKRTLTNLYNQRPTWLDLAHRKLDQAVFSAYGWPSELSDEELLERLLFLNQQRARLRDK